MRNILSACTVLFFSVLFLSGCKNSGSVNIRPAAVPDSTALLCHKGGGSGPFQQNTLEGVIYGYEHLDGVEIDIQKSLSGTLWLFHDEYFTECDGDKNRIPERTDEEIAAYVACQGNGFHLTKLEEIFDHHRKNKINKKISLDIKSWLPSKNSFTPAYLISLADHITDLISQYGMTDYVMVECENAAFLNRVKKKNPGVPCYLTTFGDFNDGMHKAYKAGYEGLSFKYHPENPPTAQMMNELRSKGLKIQFWTINDKDQIFEALKLKPDFLQTDNALIQ
jgi:glycerophosphoryl diester phosphodiesterase